MLGDDVRIITLRISSLSSSSFSIHGTNKSYGCRAKWDDQAYMIVELDWVFSTLYICIQKNKGGGKATKAYMRVYRFRAFEIHLHYAALIYRRVHIGDALELTGGRMDDSCCFCPVAQSTLPQCTRWVHLWILARRLISSGSWVIDVYWASGTCACILKLDVPARIIEYQNVPVFTGLPEWKQGNIALMAGRLVSTIGIILYEVLHYLFAL